VVRRILVCGSRTWTNGAVIHDRLAYWREHGAEVIVHGAARGADQLAGTIAATLGYRVEEYPADWRGQGRRAGIVRNLAMLDTAPDLVLAFQRAGSAGTQHTIDEARRRGVPVELETEE
jgi:SLOG family YspA-like protein